MLFEPLPDPGPRPESLHFPFAEAEDALQALGFLIEEIGHVIRVHQEAVADVRVDFEGGTRQEFDVSFSQTIGELTGRLATLHIERDLLDRLIFHVRQEVMAREDEIGSWETAMDDYLASQQPENVGPQ